ncbi:hypothetical protein TAMA11512_14060 [Selenomonas sp. TAMA-11512]|nr:hypothetical protein TAMA11512_14060 [Selenomonas sp. TAMA-11512]
MKPLHVWKKKITVALSAWVLAALLTADIPAAEASILGTVIAGVQASHQIDQQVKYLDETEEGRQELFQYYKKELGVVHESPYEAVTRRAIDRLTQGIAQTEPTILDKPFLWFINPDKSFNAFCSMGHIMSINHGFYDYIQNEDEIAVVLGHEMAHGMKRHSARGMRKKLNATIGTALVAESISGGVLTNVVMNVVYKNIMNVQITGKQEWEADALALEYIMAAGYNPGAAPAVWQRFIEKAGDNRQNTVAEILNPANHASNGERKEKYIQTIKKMSGNKVDLVGNEVRVGGKALLRPEPAGGMSSAERACFVFGNLASAFKSGHNKAGAHVEGNTVYLGSQPIIACTNGDESTSVIADRLNSLLTLK